MKQEWQRLRRPSRLRSRRCVGTTTSKCGMRPLTNLGLSPPLPLGGQKAYTILQPFVLQASWNLKLTLPPMRQILARKAQLRSFLPLTALPRRLSSLRLLRRKQIQTRKWPMVPSSLQLPLRTPPRKKRPPTTWRLS